MRTPGKRRPSAAMLVAIVAVIVALGGVSYAAVELPNNSVGTRQIKNGAVTREKLDRHLLSSLPAGPAPSAGDSQYANPVRALGPIDTTVLSAKITIGAPSRILANASTGIFITSPDTVTCGLTIQNQGGGDLANISQPYALGGLSVSTRFDVALSGSVVKAAGSYTVQVVCKSTSTFSTFGQGDLNVVAAAQ